MTTAALPRLSTPVSRPTGLFQYLADIVEGVIEAREIAARYDRLARMSASELARLGLTRTDVAHAAVFGVKGL
jgi:uncharacterized protein YjiS (DUF1127 family)